MKTILSHANLIDCVEPKVQTDVAVLIEDGRISAILRRGEPGSIGDAQVIDLKGGYLMPGLWDVHIHPDYLSLDAMPLADQVTLFGHPGWRPRLPNPALSACAAPARIPSWTWPGSVLSTPASMSARGCSPAVISSPPPAAIFSPPVMRWEVDGPYGWVEAIREQIKNGVDHIKLNLSGGIMGPAWDPHTHSFLLDDELRAAFEICRKPGFKVMAHATNPEAVKNAIRLGAHSVEHGYIMDDECIDLLLKHDTWYVPTLAISHLTASQATNPFVAAWVAQRGLSPALCCRAEAASDVHATWFRKALDAGV
jgi:imidazolonepropionase-like amidohydrolase